MSDSQKAKRKAHYRFIRIVRGCSQFIFFSVFLFLFVKTDYSGSETIEYAVNIVFRLNPFLALCTMLAARAFIALMIPGLVVLLLSLFFGRAFCGWFCPMGTLIDLSNPLFRHNSRVKPTLFPRLALIIVLFMLVSAFLQLPLAGYVDPFSILVRALVQGIYPAINVSAESFFTFTYNSAPPLVNAVTEPLFSFLKTTVLPFEQKHFDLALLSVATLFSLIMLELFQRRFFCRNICPLGALIGFSARLSLIRLHGGDEQCGTCRHCSRICRMGAIDEQRTIMMNSCSLCMDCLEQCPRQVIGFHKSVNAPVRSTPSLSRRQFLSTVAAGVLLPPILDVRTMEIHEDPGLIRPPGALAEADFVQRCVRCGECIQVCIGNGLQPTLLEAGIEGIFTPRLAARTGYCEFNCTLCGQVCPTGAIRVLSLAEKHQTRIGTAAFDKNMCLPYAKGIPCIVCEEHCPTPDKAIKFRKREVVNDRGEMVAVKQPYVIDDLCVGCGICETRCPLPGRSAISVTRAGETRNEEELNSEPYGSSYVSSIFE